MTTLSSYTAAAQQGKLPCGGTPSGCDATTERDTSVQVVVTGTRTPEATSRSTLHTGMVTREDAERRGATSVAEALEGETGLLVSSGAYDYLGNPSGVMMQGLDAERVLILRDGERVIGDSGGVTDLSEFSIQDTSRVEYVLGPTSSLYGTGAIGGVVNILTSGPQAQGLSGRARLEARSLPAALVGANLAYRGGNRWVSTSGSYRGNQAVSFPERPDSFAVPRSHRADVNLRAGIEDDVAETLVQAYVSTTDALGQNTQEVPGLGAYTLDLPERTRRVHLQLRQSYHVNQTTALRVAGSGQHFSGFSAKDRRYSPLDEERTREQTLLSLEASVNHRRGHFDWLFGLRGEREMFEQALEKTLIVEGEALTNSEPEIAPVTLQAAAAYAQLAVTIGSKFTVLPGVRAELHQRYGPVVAPRLALALRPTASTQLRLSGGRGFRTPSAKEYGFLFDHSSLGYRVIGNPDLNPERSWGLQGDVGYAPTRRVQLRVAGFYNALRSLITTAYAGQFSAGVNDYSYVNVGSAATAGVDATTTLRVTQRVESHLSYSYLHTANHDDQTPLPNRPAHTVTAALDVLPLDELRLTTRCRAISDAYVAPHLDTPGFVKLDLRAEYRFMDNASVYAGALDVLDSQRDPNRSGDTRPLTGTQFYAGVIGHFPQEL